MTNSITLTPAALAKVKEKVQKEQGFAVQLSVKKTGCSGYKCVLDVVKSIPAGDTTFQFEEGVVLCIDEKNLKMLNGTQIDYVKENFSHQFRFDIPSQKGVCGCGESFQWDGEDLP